MKILSKDLKKIAKDDVIIMSLKNPFENTTIEPIIELE